MKWFSVSVNGLGPHMSAAISLKSSLNFMGALLKRLSRNNMFFWLHSWTNTLRGLGKGQRMSVKILSLRDPVYTFMMGCSSV